MFLRLAGGNKQGLGVSERRGEWDLLCRRIIDWGWGLVCFVVAADNYCCHPRACQGRTARRVGGRPWRGASPGEALGRRAPAGQCYWQLVSRKAVCRVWSAGSGGGAGRQRWFACSEYPSNYRACIFFLFLLFCWEFVNSHLGVLELARRPHHFWILVLHICAEMYALWWVLRMSIWDIKLMFFTALKQHKFCLNLILGVSLYWSYISKTRTIVKSSYFEWPWFHKVQVLDVKSNANHKS